MTVQELSELGNEQPVIYKGERVTFEYMHMRFAYWTSRKQPMMARIRHASGRLRDVYPSQLKRTFK